MRHVDRRGAIRERVRQAWPLLAGLALLALVVLPARLAAIRGDDAWWMERRGLLELERTSLFQEMLGSARTSLEAGRPGILGGSYGHVVQWVFDGHWVAYRLYLILLTLVAAALLYRLVLAFGASAVEGLIVLVILAGAIQFRTYHDAMLGYLGAVQLVLILTLASLIWFIRSLRERDRRALLISFLLFLPCPFIYEIAYPLAGLHLAIALIERRGRAAVRAALPFLALAAAFTVVSFVGRLTAPAVVESYSVSSSPLRIVRSYLIQLFPPLPASSVILENAGFIGDPTKAELLAGAWRGAVVFVGLLALFLRMGRTREMLSSGSLGALAVLGAVLWLGPPGLLAAAPKFQAELGPGRGHIPVLIQVFGWALVAAAGSLALLRAASRRSPLAHAVSASCLALGLGAAAGVVGYTNVRVVALETPVRETRDLAQEAVEAGLVSTVPERSSLLFSPRDLNWPLGNWARTEPGLEAMMLHRGRRRFDARFAGPPAGDPLGCAPGGFPPRECAPLSRKRGWVHIRARRGGGTVIFASSVARGTPRTFTQASQEPASALRVFVRGDQSPPLLTGQTGQAPWSSAGVRWTRVSRGEGWALYEASLPHRAAPLASSIDDPRAQVNFVAPTTAGQIVRIYGTKRLLP